MMNSHYIKALAVWPVAALALGLAVPVLAQEGDGYNPGKSLDGLTKKKLRSILDLLTKFGMKCYEIVGEEVVSEEVVSEEVICADKQVIMVEPAQIRVLKDGTIYWGKGNDLKISEDMDDRELPELVTQLETKKQEADSCGSEDVVILWLEDGIPIRRVADLINAISQAGITAIAFTTFSDD